MLKYRLLFFALAMFQWGCKPVENPGSPNILIINVDDLGWMDTGFMGNQFYETPNIDALASRGLVFTQAYAGAANCAPSRACMMTGLNTPRHGIYTVGSSKRGASSERQVIPIENTSTLHDSLTTIAEALNVLGYICCQAGKWHLSPDARDHGFDFSIGGSRAGHPHSYYPPYENVDIEAVKGEHLTDCIMNEVLDFIDIYGDRPFFLYYAPYAVHTPIQAIDSLKEKFIGKTGHPGMNNIDYASMINNLDRNIGRLIDTLRELNIYENTFIIFTSDNGGLFRISQQKPLRAGKGSYYEGGIRVPTFFVWEKHIDAGINTTSPISQLDFFPTILDLTKALLPGKTFDGINLSPLLLEKTEAVERSFFWHFPIYLEQGNSDTRDPSFRTRPGSAIRKGNWKLLEYFEDGALELFDLTNDPSEQHDLSEIKLEKSEELMDLLQQWRVETGAQVPKELNPEFKGL